MLEYLIVIEKAGENFCAYSPDVMGCIATGDTIEETQRNMAEALEFHLESMMDDNEEIPTPKGLAHYSALSEPFAQHSAYITHVHINLPQAA
jgi:predicted RNase H-like HicB family nuclease